MKEIDAAIEALEAALSDGTPYLIRCKSALAGLRSLKEQEPKPLPGADWTITMRRMMNIGCSKRKCTCKPEDAENCIWWDEPGDAPTPEAKQETRVLLSRESFQMMGQRIAELEAASNFDHAEYKRLRDEKDKRIDELKAQNAQLLEQLKHAVAAMDYTGTVAIMHSEGEFNVHQARAAIAQVDHIADTSKMALEAKV